MLSGCQNDAFMLKRSLERVKGWIISCLEALTIAATDNKVIVIVFCKKVEANNGCSYIIYYADGLTDSCAVDVNQVGIEIWYFSCLVNWLLYIPSCMHLEKESIFSYFQFIKFRVLNGGRERGRSSPWSNQKRQASFTETNIIVRLHVWNASVCGWGWKEELRFGCTIDKGDELGLGKWIRERIRKKRVVSR